MGNRDQRRGRAQSRQQHEPRALPSTASTNGSTAIDTREQAKPPAPIVAPGEREILGLLSSDKVRRAMSVRLGRIFSVDEMIAMVATSIRQSPLLAKCDPMTVVGAVMECAQVGLRLDRTLGQAYLVPFYSSKRQCYEAQLVLGYRGMITMAEHAERVLAVRAKIVYAKDRFVYEEGLDPILEHKPHDGRDRGNPTHVYSVVHKADGLSIPYVMPWWKIEDLRDAQLKRGNTIWGTHTEEMGLKTTIRRGLKYHPLAPAQQRLANLDELAEEGVEQDLDIIGSAVMDDIASSAEALGAAKDAARNETAAGVLSSPEGRAAEPAPSSSAPADPPAPAPAPAPAPKSDEPGGLTPEEEAAFEAAIAEREKGGQS